MPSALTVAYALGLTALIGAAGGAMADQTPVAITAFNAWCFKAGQTEAEARKNMRADTASFELSFWDDSLEPRPTDAPRGVERRCEVVFEGAHSLQAITALRRQMQTPPVFGTKIPLPDTHTALEGTALIEGRALLQGRVAVVHVGTRDQNGKKTTFMAVDRLYDGLGHTN
ncbi:hypothetical protein OS190_15785 [Sulfitobacter sp. F26204]|uniref:hypothetical protein n=1 Tax=Sulfitobacter sp. F26204 TaxID=2996014 RepID=UPI00225E04C9|nr:hypothetical protein [Sulfitobacter sp. F26204]MCX7561030.1 hypothetical protein [Sulfitobacter sp. F26204]